MVSERKIYVLPIVSLREILTLWGGAISDPRGMLGRINVKLHITILHTKYKSFGCCGFREEGFFHIFSIVSLWQIMMPPGCGLYGPQGHS